VVMSPEMGSITTFSRLWRRERRFQSLITTTNRL